MISLKPDFYIKFNCPECGSNDTKVNDIVFQGIHILADCLCEGCGLEFYSDLPTGQALYTPVSFGKNNNKLYDKYNVGWFSNPLFESYISKNDDPINIDKKVFKTTKKVIILNCMDYLYGHVLLKLFNAEYYLDRYKDYGLVIIIPKNFGWLLPDGISEAWLIDQNLKECKNWNSNIENFFKKETERFSEIYLSLAFSHPDPSGISIHKFAKHKEFNMDNYLDDINITFITREDRTWETDGSLEDNKLISKFFGKFNIRIDARKSKIKKQNKLIEKLAMHLRKTLPDIKFNVAGLGKSIKFSSCVNDLRETAVDDDIEKTWCSIYSKSQIVIGIHGSNMIIPSALCGGIIEILPENRYGNIVQDIFTRYERRKSLFFYRFVDEHSNPKRIAAVALSMIKDYKSFDLNMSSKNLKHSIYNDTGFWKNEREKNDLELKRILNDR
jgi:hypothetical protein